MGEIDFPRKNTLIGYQIPNVQSLKHTGSIIKTEQFIFRNIHVFLYMHMCTIVIYDKVAHEFQKEQRGIYRIVWREDDE